MNKKKSKRLIETWATPKKIKQFLNDKKQFKIFACNSRKG
jgi:hypothetical protein